MTAVDLLLEVIRDHSPASKWTNAPLESFRRVENTNRGEIGEDFIRRYLEENGIETISGSRLRPTDLTIADRRFEVKTASEDKGGNFQFNHIRMDREYDYLLCLGVSPAGIWFNVWRKGGIGVGAFAESEAQLDVLGQHVERAHGVRKISAHHPGAAVSELSAVGSVGSAASRERRNNGNQGDKKGCSLRRGGSRAALAGLASFRRMPESR